MRSIILSLLERYLVRLAQVTLAIDKPVIIGITGSVGKTTAKEAVFHLLETAKLPVRKTGGNLNFDIGIAMTILGYDHSPAIWEWPWAILIVHLNWLLQLSRLTHLPEYLVVEMGIDRLGDMKRLTKWLKPSIGVVTWIGEGHHLEYLKDAPTIAREKGEMLRVLPKNGLAILPAKDPNIAILKAMSSADTELFQATGVESIEEILAIIAKRLDIQASIAEESMQTFKQPKGRLNIFVGIKDTTILDDSYNTSLPAIRMALTKLSELQAKRKVAILGDILEQGDYEKEHHEKAADLVHETADLFIGVGRRMQNVKPDYWFADPDEAALKIPDLLEAGDGVLVKGSQGMRLEKISYSLIADKRQAKRLLPRQDRRWQQIPFGNP